MNMDSLWTPQLDSSLYRAIRIAISGIAVFLALQLKDDFLVGVGLAVTLAVMLDILWWLYERDSQANA